MLVFHSFKASGSTFSSLRNFETHGDLVNLDLWNLLIAIVSLGYTYQERIMTKASTVFKKINFL